MIECGNPFGDLALRCVNTHIHTLVGIRVHEHRIGNIPKDDINLRFYNKFRAYVFPQCIYTGGLYELYIYISKYMPSLCNVVIPTLQTQRILYNIYVFEILSNSFRLAHRIYVVYGEWSLRM